MKIQSLENTDPAQLMKVINMAFSDYIVPFQLNLDQLKFKIFTEGIRLDLSFGVYSSERLVAFVLHGLRMIGDELVAYNAATGVVPDYRGRGFVGAMYDKLLPKLNELGVKQMILEVIERNQSAIRVYEKLGYSVHRKLDCFSGIVQTSDPAPDIEIREIKEFQWPVFTSFWDIQPSWQNSVITLEDSIDHCRIVGAYQQNTLAGYVVFNPVSRRIQQISVAQNYRRQGIATSMISYVSATLSKQELFINNVDHTSKATLLFIKSLGLSFKLAQFEMLRML
ncbi:GNAT family N-acetyltransferase [Sphingobacterium spiritivorum]|uniref:GNAT family N-acetyltransferase n=1 Tax=Sphingobacterium spiritivorum TaxID=258 RepID=UPI0019181D5E|nr:GNAT family N-acetyltransferase [Sphingobacterium spiritivorum]QQT24507.1 GNAT family N-acetyltransferase [Sphingobacterium spiritivorum]